MQRCAKAEGEFLKYMQARTWGAPVLSRLISPCDVFARVAEDFVQASTALTAIQFLK